MKKLAALVIIVLAFFTHFQAVHAATGCSVTMSPVPLIGQTDAYQGTMAITNNTESQAIRDITIAFYPQSNISNMTNVGWGVGSGGGGQFFIRIHTDTNPITPHTTQNFVLNYQTTGTTFFTVQMGNTGPDSTEVCGLDNILLSDLNGTLTPTNIPSSTPTIAPTATVTPTPTSVPSPTPFLSAATIAVSPHNGTQKIGIPFKVAVEITVSGTTFQAASANVTLSSNLMLLDLDKPTTSGCHFLYSVMPKKTDPSFAGTIVGSPSRACALYTLTLKPTAKGTGTIIFTNPSIKAANNHGEIPTKVQNASLL